MHALLGGLCGLLFGAGLALSGMTNPARVVGFLDIGGHWDPTLALVMAAALAVALPVFQWALRQPRPWFDQQFHLSPRRQIDRHLLLGALIFGVGWGLSGLCPGPAIAGLVFGVPELYGFVAAMALGAWLVDRLDPAKRAAASP